MLLERSSGAENAESEEGVAALADFESRFSTNHNVRRSAARVASKYLRMSYAGPVSLVLIVCWSCLKLSITDWNSDAMIMDFEKNCYHSPHTTTTRLGKREQQEHTFLESTFKIEDNKFRFWLKKDNTLEQPNKIWRYQRFESATSFEQRRAVLST